ncbi:hypothetical protein Tcan_13073 [Toxocara canis]|uniref:Uncharacterized protein n=1 Tax=Toxocara canis TaxID=6265 RepID=A0A0B2URL7_TOXCA|nr:hypothetical protein Tcan_13073 [Toxocara canis]
MARQHLNNGHNAQCRFRVKESTVRRKRSQPLLITEAYVVSSPATRRCTTGRSNMENKMGRSAVTSIWRCLDAASSGSRQMEKLPAASMERTMKSMKSQLFKVFKVRYYVWKMER